MAFLLPALIHTDGQPIPRSERGGPNVIVLAPTRELALQIESEVKKYTYKNIKWWVFNLLWIFVPDVICD